MPVVNHAVTMPSLNNAPNPSGTLQFPEQQGPSLENLLQLSPSCTIAGHNSHAIKLLFCAEQGFSLGDNDPAVFGPDDTVSFNYDPPLT